LNVDQENLQELKGKEVIILFRMWLSIHVFSSCNVPNPEVGAGSQFDFVIADNKACTRAGTNVKIPKLNSTFGEQYI